MIFTGLYEVKIREGRLRLPARWRAAFGGEAFLRLDRDEPEIQEYAGGVLARVAW